MTGLMIKGDAATGKVIGRTVVRLPSEVQEFVQRHVLFISTKRTASGMMVRFADHWLPQCVVVLAEDAMRGKWAVDIVAHEIAHAYADHPHEESREDMEADADTLAVRWGFRSKPKGSSAR